MMKTRGLQIYRYQTTQFAMIEKQIKVKIIAIYNHSFLAFNKAKSGTKFD